MHLLLVVRYTQLCRDFRGTLLHNPEILWEKQNVAKL